VLAIMLMAMPAMAAEKSRDLLQIENYPGWVEQFKTSNRGPFIRIRWYCEDGAVLEPGQGACAEHGGGRQHGQWNDKATRMREQGLYIANVLAAVETDSLTGNEAELEQLSQILLEQFLVRADDGWVFRKSRFNYRGSLQIEDEEASAARLMLAMLNDELWRSPDRFLLLRESLRLLPLASDSKLALKIRQMASDLAEKDDGFRDLRIKLHSQPDAQDPERVLKYTSKLPSELQPDFEALAALLDRFYAPRMAEAQLEKLAKETSSRHLSLEFEAVRRILNGKQVNVLAGLGERMKSWRKLLQSRSRLSPLDRLRLLQASLIVEQEVFVRATVLLSRDRTTSRLQRLQWLQSLASALYGAGLMSERQLDAFNAEVRDIQAQPKAKIADYYEALGYLGRVPQWAQRSLEFRFSQAVEHWQPFAPLAIRLVPDRLRESPLLPYSRLLDQLVADASDAAGVRHNVFGHRIVSHLRALNPGLNRGVLLAAPAPGERYRTDGIYILPSTTHSLPPVAGIITQGEGSSLSHIQLLARNMGIPNLVADERLIQELKEHLGARVVLAVSHGGIVSIQRDGHRWTKYFGKQHAAGPVSIDPDLKRLNLKDRKMHPLSDLRAEDSGRIAGPKAANLGELHHYYPRQVPGGVVIPFGRFRAHLDRPLVTGGPSVFEWMRSEYARLKRIDNEDERHRQTVAMLSKLRQWIVSTDPGARFRRDLVIALRKVFGNDDHIAVFVRSDTNVEDLPGFSGAGLNLTVPNVVGINAIISAIQKVWASPYSERAFAWRQSHMQHPEHVYPGVLLLKSFNSEKSGVMVTTDVDSGDRGWLSIAVNEGVGGAVEGQAAEELRVNRNSGMIKLMSIATAPLQTQLFPEGGVGKVPASGAEQLLSPKEVEQLRRFAKDVEQRFPLPRDESGRAMPADIEFGFRQGKFALFQLRPFVESRRARESEVLIDMDSELARGLDGNIDLALAPRIRDLQ